MAAASNIPRDIQDAVRDVLDRRIKISIRRLVKQEIRAEKTENRVLAFSPCRLFVLAAKVPSKLEHSFHFLDIQALESTKPNQLLLTVDGKVYTFINPEPNTDDVNHMITHIGISLKQIFPAFPLERLIVKVEVTPPERLRTMNDIIRGMESKEAGPCGGYTTQYACMCDYHSLPYREEVAWDVDTIYLSQDSRELCLRDFDHLSAKDTIPIISALEHNTWFTGLNVSNVRLTPEACNEILKVMKRNSIIEDLNLANTGIKTEFMQKLSTALLSNSGTQLSSLDISGNLIDDRGVTHLMGTLKSLSRGLSHLDLSRTGISTRCLSKVAESISQSQSLLSSLQELKLAENGQKGEDIAGLYQCVAQPNVLTTLDLTATECAMDSLVGPLRLGCPHLATLSLSRTTFTHRRSKEAVVPVAWKQFFSSTCSLQRLDVSATRIPPDAVKELLLGVGSNRHLKDLDLDLSSNELGAQGAQIIAGCISNIQSVGRLDLSNNGFDADLKTLVSEIAKNRHLKHLALGRNFGSIKPKHLSGVLDAIVQMLQEEETMLESLSLADSKLKSDTARIINALGSNTSLIYIDLSGNAIGDYGARLLGKALQINNKLHTVVWDRNAITAQGFEDIADALNKNYTLKRMPFPVNDAAVAMRTQAERTEAALQKVEQLLQRNHSPRRFASDQQYRLQQGFLISSTQQMVDRLCVQVQDSVNALTMGNSGAPSEDIEEAEKVIKDADNCKQLLPKLQAIAMTTQDAGNTVETTLQAMADKLKSVMEETMQKSVDDMLLCTSRHCEGVMSDKAFRSEIEVGSKSRSSLPKDFAKLVLDSVNTDVFNKISELNLAVAAYISDSVIGEVINKLSDSHKGLTNQLNLRKSGLSVREQPEKIDTESEKEKAGEEGETRVRQSSGGSPKLSSKRKSVFSRKLRPQSTIDRDPSPSGEISADSVSEHNSGADDSTTNVRVAIPEHATDEMGETVSKSKVPQSTTKDSQREGFSKLDQLPDLPSVEPKRLEHLNKARPKRIKTRAATRPVAPNFSTNDEGTEDGGNLFFAGKQTLSEAELDEKSKPRPSVTSKGAPEESTVIKPEKKKSWSPMNLIKDKVEKKEEKDKEKDKDKKEEKKEKGAIFSSGFGNFFRNKASKGETKDKEKKQESLPKETPLPQKSDTSKVYSRNSQAESPKAQRPEPVALKPPQPSAPVVKETASLEVGSVVQAVTLTAPRASEESLDENDEVKVKTPHSKTDTSEDKKEEERLKVSKADSKSSSSEEEEDGGSGVASTAVEEGKEDEEDKPESPVPPARSSKGPPGMHMGFGANLMADLKSQKRFSHRLPSPEESTASPSPAKESPPSPAKATPPSPAKTSPTFPKTSPLVPAKASPTPSKDSPSSPIKTALPPAKPANRDEEEGKSEETNNNNMVNGKEESVKKDKPAAKSAEPEPAAKPAESVDSATAKLAEPAPAEPVTDKPVKPVPPKTALLPPGKASTESGSSPRPAPRVLLPPKKPAQPPAGAAAAGDSGKPSSDPVPSAPTAKPRPTPPAKPKPPITAPKPRPSVKRDSPPEEDSSSGTGEATCAGERKSAEGEIVYDSSTLRMSVKDKIKRLSQVKFEPPSSGAHKKATSLPRDAKLPDSVSG